MRPSPSKFDLYAHIFTVICIAIVAMLLIHTFGDLHS